MSDSEKTVSVKLNERWIERLDRLAKKGGLSRHQLMRNLIEVGMDAISIGKAVGLFQLGLMIRDMFDVQMKPEPGEEKPLPLKLDEKFLAKIDDVARRGDLTRHQLMRNLIHVGVEEVEAAARIGLFQASVWVRDLEDSFKRIIQDGKNAAKGARGDADILDEKGGVKE